MILFTFAYAGGDGHAFYPLVNELKSYDITIEPFFYKGRGNRQKEGPYKSILEIAEDAANFIEKYDLSQGFALLGHSMGCVVVYECYYELLSRGCKLPSAIYFSGSVPPDVLSNNLMTDNDEEFIDKLKLLGGLDPKILEMQEFREFYFPIIKNDVKIFHEYNFKEKNVYIDVPVTILTGDEDEVKGDKVKGWEKHTNGKPEFIELQGDHFFLFNCNHNYNEIFNRLIS